MEGDPESWIQMGSSDGEEEAFVPRQDSYFVPELLNDEVSTIPSFTATADVAAAQNVYSPPEREEPSLLAAKDLIRLIRKQNFLLVKDADLSVPKDFTNFMFLEKLLQKCLIEIQMVNEGRRDLLKLGKMDMEVMVLGPNGVLKRKTPDFVTGATLDASGKLRVPPKFVSAEDGTRIEFKVYPYARGGGEEELEINKNILKYADSFLGETPEQIISRVKKSREVLVKIIYTDSFISGILSTQLRSTMRMLELARNRANDLEKVRGKGRVTKENYVSKSFLMEAMGDKVRDIYPDTNHRDKDMSFVKSPMDYTMDALDELYRIEGFLNQNYMPCKEMGGKLEFLGSNPNIFKEHLYDRTKNGEKAAELVGKRMQGERPNWLFRCPYYLDHEKDFDISWMLMDSALDKGWELIRNIEYIGTVAKDEITEMHKLNKLRAFMAGEADEEQIREYNKRNETSFNREEIKDHITDRIGEYRGVLKEMFVESGFGKGVESTSVGRGGGIQVSFDSEILKDGKVKFRSWSKGKAKGDFSETGNYKDLEKDEPRLEFFDFFEEGQDFDKWYKSLKLKGMSMSVPSFRNLYTQDTIANGVMNELDKLSDIMLESVLGSTGSILSLRLVSLYRSLLMAGGRGETKGYNPNEIIHCIDPVTGIRALLTLSPSPIKTGAVVFYGCVKKEDWGNSQPSWVGPFKDIKVVGDLVYYRTDTHRLNLTYVVEAHQMAYGTIATAVALEGLGSRIHNSSLYWMQFLEMNLQVVTALSHVYMFYKSSFVQGNFGKFELPKKLVGFRSHDLVATSILYRLHTGHKRFTEETSLMAESGSISGVIDPVYKVKCTGWMSLLILAYMKQMGSQGDGVDVVNMLSKHIEANAEFESDCRNSPFDAGGFDWTKPLTMKDWVSLLLSGSGGKPVNYSYFGELIMAEARESCERVKRENGGIINRTETFKKWNQPAVETAKKSKTLVPTAEGSVMRHMEGMPELTSENVDKASRIEATKAEMDSDGRKKTIRSQYPGIYSEDTGPALMRHEEFLKRTLGIKIRIINIPDGWDANRAMTLEEMVLVDLSLTPFYMVLTQQNKDQKGDKRGFMVQMLIPRNMCIFYDYVGRPILNEEETDQVHIPGMEKYIEIQKRRSKIGAKRGMMSISGDMAKFGDKYAPPSMEAQLLGFFKGGLMTQKEYDVCCVITSGLKHRKILIPASSMEAFERVKVEQEKGADMDQVDIKGKDFVLRMTDPNGVLYKYLTEVDVSSGLAGHPFLHALANFPGVMRRSGGTLGVFNVMWSCMSANIATFQNRMLGVIMRGNPVDMVVWDTHSDDTQALVQTPSPPDEAFTISMIPGFLNRLRVDNKLGINKYMITDNGLSVVGPDGRIISRDVVPKWYMSKFVLCTFFLVTRFFSQNPSPYKVTFGEHSEMLQTVSTNDGKVFEPLSRDTFVVAVESQGSSYSEDLLNGMSKLLNLAVKRTPHDIIVALQKLVNVAIRDKYGMNDYPYSFDRIPQSGGSFAATPGTMIAAGLDANLARLISRAVYGGEAQILERLKVMVRNLQIWGGMEATTVGPSKALDDEMMSDLFTVYGTEEDEYDDANGSALETFKDFYLRLFRGKVGGIKFGRMMEDLDPTLRKGTGMSSMSVGKNLLAELKEKFGILTLISGVEDVVLLYLKKLSRFVTERSTSRVTRGQHDSWAKGRLGYLNRRMTNPFTKDVRIHLAMNGFMVEDTLTIKEIWETVEFLSGSSYKFPKVSEEAVLTIIRRYERIVTLAGGLYGVVEVVDRETNFEDEKTIYSKMPSSFIGTASSPQLFMKAMVVHFLGLRRLEEGRLERMTVDKASLKKQRRIIRETGTFVYRPASVIELSKVSEEDMEASYDYNFVFIRFPQLRTDTLFRGYLEMTMAILKEYRVNTAEEIRMQVRLLANLHAPTGYPGIAKVLVGETVGASYSAVAERTNFSYGKVLVFHEVTRTHYNPVGPRITLPDGVGINGISRVLAVTMMRNFLEFDKDYLVLGRSIRSPGDAHPVSISKALNEAVRSKLEFSAVWSSSVFTAMCYVRALGGLTFNISRGYDIATQFESYILKYDDWMKVAIFRRRGDEKERGKWGIVCSTSDTDEYGTVGKSVYVETKARYALTVGCVLSFIVSKKSDGIQGIGSLLTGLSWEGAMGDESAVVVNYFSVSDSTTEGLTKKSLTSQAVFITTKSCETFLSLLGVVRDPSEIIEVGTPILGGVSFRKPLKRGDVVNIITPWHLPTRAVGWESSDDTNGEYKVFVSDSIQQSAPMLPMYLVYSALSDSLLHLTSEEVNFYHGQSYGNDSRVSLKGGIETSVEMRIAEVKTGVLWECLKLAEEVNDNAGIRNVRDPIFWNSTPIDDPSLIVQGLFKKGSYIAGLPYCSQGTQSSLIMRGAVASLLAVYSYESSNRLMGPIGTSVLNDTLVVITAGVRVLVTPPLGATAVRAPGGKPGYMGYGRDYMGQELFRYMEDWNPGMVMENAGRRLAIWCTKKDGYAIMEILRTRSKDMRLVPINDFDEVSWEMKEAEVPSFPLTLRVEEILKRRYPGLIEYLYSLNGPDPSVVELDLVTSLTQVGKGHISRSLMLTMMETSRDTSSISGPSMSGSYSVAKNCKSLSGDSLSGFDMAILRCGMGLISGRDGGVPTWFANSFEYLYGFI